MIAFQHASSSYDSHRMQVRTHRIEGLHDINFTMKDGECVLLCGKSDCGKTTTARLVDGLIPNAYPGKPIGNALLDGRNLSELSIYEIASLVDSVFQNPKTQFFNVDTDSGIAFGVENRALPREQTARKVAAAAKILEIETLRGRNISSLSGGEEQKVAFAFIYTTSPMVHLLDGPFSNLDVETVDALKAHLKEFKSRGKTILIVKHRLCYLVSIVDRILVLNERQITEDYSAGGPLTLIDKERRMMGFRTTDLRKELPELIVKREQENSLELKNVSLFYRKETMMRNIDAKFSRSEVIALVGKNGIGRTIFSRAPCGLHQEIKGDFFRNDKITSIKRRQKISYMVMQDVNFQFFAGSVEAECSFSIRNPNAALIAETTDTLDPTPFAGRHFGTLSGGQKQRLAVAVGQICKKELIISGGPTSGLDYESTTSAAKIIHTLSKQGKIVFIVTHDYEFLCRTCSRTLAFSNDETSDDLKFQANNKAQIAQLPFPVVETSRGGDLFE